MPGLSELISNAREISSQSMYFSKKAASLLRCTPARTECFSEIRSRIADAHIRELQKISMTAITSDAKRLKTDDASDTKPEVPEPEPPAKTDKSVEKEEAAADGTAITGVA